VKAKAEPLKRVEIIPTAICPEPRPPHPVLLPRTRLGEFATQHDRIRKRMRWGEGTMLQRLPPSPSPLAGEGGVRGTTGQHFRRLVLLTLVQLFEASPLERLWRLGRDLASGCTRLLAAKVLLGSLVHDVEELRLTVVTGKSPHLDAIIHPDKSRRKRNRLTEPERHFAAHFNNPERKDLSRGACSINRKNFALEELACTAGRRFEHDKIHRSRPRGRKTENCDNRKKRSQWVTKSKHTCPHNRNKQITKIILSGAGAAGHCALKRLIFLFTPALHHRNHAKFRRAFVIGTVADPQLKRRHHPDSGGFGRQDNSKVFRVRRLTDREARVRRYREGTS